VTGAPTLLPPSDAAWLEDAYPGHEVAEEAGMTCVVVPAVALPPGYDRLTADVLVRLPPLFPDLAPDMWWTDPPLTLANGSPPAATELREIHLGRTWQRWSRHLPADQWRPGTDGLRTYVAQVKAELRRTAA